MTIPWNSAYDSVIFLTANTAAQPTLQVHLNDPASVSEWCLPRASTGKQSSACGTSTSQNNNLVSHNSRIQATDAPEASLNNDLHGDQQAHVDAATALACPDKPPQAARHGSNSEPIQPSSEIGAFHGLDVPSDPVEQSKAQARASGQGPGPSQPQACKQHHESHKHDSNQEGASQAAAEDGKDGSWCWEVCVHPTQHQPCRLEAATWRLHVIQRFSIMYLVYCKLCITRQDVHILRLVHVCLSKAAHGNMWMGALSVDEL